ncbi:unnamed protein product, partial [Prorocentrum cordatum]
MSISIVIITIASLATGIFFGSRARAAHARPAMAQALERLREALRACEGGLVSSGSADNASCDSFVERGPCFRAWRRLRPAARRSLPPAAASAFAGSEPAELGCIGRSLRFGRLLWCLASGVHAAPEHPPVARVLELFAGSGGGSTLLLAHGLQAARGPEGRRAGAARARWLLTFEEDWRNVAAACAVLGARGLRAQGAHAAAPGALGQLARLLSAGGEGESAATWIVHGRPVLRSSASEVGGNASAGPLRDLCSAAAGIDLAVLDPNHALQEEWPVTEAVCSPRYVALHNVNLPLHAGWVRERLLASGEWAEVLAGAHDSAWDPPGHPAARRAWSLLARIPSDLEGDVDDHCRYCQHHSSATESTPSSSFVQ